MARSHELSTMIEFAPLLQAALQPILLILETRQ
jgi:hypothetical protein